MDLLYDRLALKQLVDIWPIFRRIVAIPHDGFLLVHDLIKKAG